MINLKKYTCIMFGVYGTFLITSSALLASPDADFTVAAGDTEQREAIEDLMGIEDFDNQARHNEESPYAKEKNRVRHIIKMQKSIIEKDRKNI